MASPRWQKMRNRPRSVRSLSGSDPGARHQQRFSRGGRDRPSEVGARQQVGALA